MRFIDATIGSHPHTFTHFFLFRFTNSIQNDFKVTKEDSKMRLSLLDPADRKKLPKIRRPKSTAEKRAAKIRKARRLARMRNAAAITIQCACRQFLARTVLADLRANAAATRIQMCWRTMKFNERVTRKKVSATKIQQRSVFLLFFLFIIFYYVFRRCCGKLQGSSHSYQA